MVAPTLDFDVYQGDTKQLQISVVDRNGAPFSLSGCTIRWQFSKQSATSPTYKFGSVAVVSKQIGSGITVTNAASGLLSIDLDSEDTKTLKGDFYHELEIVDSSDRIQTVLNGTMTVLPALIPNP